MAKVRKMAFGGMGTPAAPPRGTGGGLSGMGSGTKAAAPGSTYTNMSNVTAKPAAVVRRPAGMPPRQLFSPGPARPRPDAGQPPDRGMGARDDKAGEENNDRNRGRGSLKKVLPKPPGSVANRNARAVQGTGGNSGGAEGGAMKKGGMTSSASKRADGCAVKGKTKGKYV